ncbi:hypothetical protein PFISCL1PPCAC_9450, partial [Pristionchus fissidentatus]
PSFFPLSLPFPLFSPNSSQSKQPMEENQANKRVGNSEREDEGVVGEPAASAALAADESSTRRDHPMDNVDNEPSPSHSNCIDSLSLTEFVPPSTSGSNVNLVHDPSQRLNADSDTGAKPSGSGTSGSGASGSGASGSGTKVIPVLPRQKINAVSSTGTNPSGSGASGSGPDEPTGSEFQKPESSGRGRAGTISLASSRSSQPRDPEFKYHSMTRANLKEWASSWRCSLDYCKTGRFDKFTPAQNRKAFVLLCGHLLCERCRTTLRNNSGGGALKCPIRSCPQMHTTVDFQAAPIVSHIETMLVYLSPQGFGCRSCSLAKYERERSEWSYFEQCASSTLLIGAAGYPHYPREMMRFCTSCEVYEYPWCCGLKVPEPMFVCLFCSIDHDKTYPNYPAPFESVDETQVSRPSKVEFLTRESKRHIGDPWHLAFLPQEVVIDIAEKILKCPCGRYYSKEASDNPPTILDCGHLVCTICAEKNVARTLLCTALQCPRPQSDRIRPALDLAWVMERLPAQFSHCHMCGKNHTKELCPKHQCMDENRVKKECQGVVCLYCIASDNFSTHRYS